MTHPTMRLYFAVTVAVLLGALPAAARTPMLQLMRPDSLVGWDHGTPPPSGWTIADGRLQGDARSTPLLSGFTFGDFELRFEWSVADGGTWKLSLPDVPASKGFELTLAEGPGCGRLSDGDNELEPGADVKPRKGKPHATLIRREKGKLTVVVDGKWLYDAAVKPDRRFGLGLALATGGGALANLRAKEPPGAPIFNGKDLTGFYTKGDIDKWRVRGGKIVRLERAGDYLRVEKEYGNFTWYLQYRMEQGTNSGLSVRTPREGWPTADGMELQLYDQPYEKELVYDSALAIYGHVLPLARNDRSDEWNHVVVKADGRMISAWVNGELVQQVNTLHHPELKHRLLSGWIGVQDHGNWTQLRDIRVHEAPAGHGLDAWMTPQPPTAIAAILDRLLNPERLSAAGDDLRAGAVTAVVEPDEPAVDPPKTPPPPAGDASKALAPPAGNPPKAPTPPAANPPQQQPDSKNKAAPKPVEHVLANLTGPGAIVRIARSNDKGRLAFYFDGEKEPRVECAPGELATKLPQIGKDTEPLLTCVTYRKGVRIVLRDADEAAYRFDYVGVPRLPLETFSGPEAGFPRGWLLTAETHLRWIGGGRFHEHDGVPRFESAPCVIKPGRTKRLLHVDGAGIAKRLKLLADKSVLENNDLWLEVTVDGEKKPAVAAPARFLFPALTSNYDNYLLADQGGPTLMLAMPFANGITISARNAGGRKIRNVGVSIPVVQATDQTRADVAGRMRLRGIFREPDGSGELVRLGGRGRWVGLVCEEPTDAVTEIAALLVDGRPVDGWSADTLDGFLGGRGEFRKQLSGRQGPLWWRYLALVPVDFQKSLVLKTPGGVGERLVLFYAK